jgi:hypothetical protein
MENTGAPVPDKRRQWQASAAEIEATWLRYACQPNIVPLRMTDMGRPLNDRGSIQLPYRERTVSPGA